MIDFDKYTELLQWHNGVKLFNYDVVVDWALEMLQRGVESENMLILASFSKPVDRIEIKPYVSGVLEDLKLEEKIGEYSWISNSYFHAQMIVDDYEVRKNLTFLFNMCIESNYSKHLMPFYLLYHGWWSLEEDGCNYYYDGANLENIDKIVKLEANKFISEYIAKKPNEVELLKLELRQIVEIDSSISGFWNKFKSKIKKKNTM